MRTTRLKSNTMMLLISLAVGLQTSCINEGDGGDANITGIALAGVGEEAADQYSLQILNEFLVGQVCLPTLSLNEPFPRTDLSERKVSRRVPAPHGIPQQNASRQRLTADVSIAKNDGITNQWDFHFINFVKPPIRRLIDKCNAEGTLAEQRIRGNGLMNFRLQAFQRQCQQKGCDYFQSYSHGFKSCSDAVHGATIPAYYAESIPVPLNYVTHISYNPKISKNALKYNVRAYCSKKVPPPPPGGF